MKSRPSRPSIVRTVISHILLVESRVDRIECRLDELDHYLTALEANSIVGDGALHVLLGSNDRRPRLLEPPDDDATEEE